MQEKIDNSVGIYFEEDDKNMVENFEEIQNFLQNIIYSFKEESEYFFNKWEFFPFTDKEKQILSVLLPAIHQNTKNVWVEQRFKNNKGKNRFFDVSTIDKNNNVYFAEIKHCYKSYRSPKHSITKKIYKEWNNAITQINDLIRDNLKEEFYMDKIGNFRWYRVALMVMPTYIASPNIKKYKEPKNKTEEELVEYSKNVFRSFSEDPRINLEKKPSIVMTYATNDYKNKENKFKNIQIYPFVSFIAKIELVEEI